MGNESGVSKLKGSMGSYQAQAGGSSAPSADMVNKGFELKPGSNGKSSGAALPIYQGPSLGFQQKPESQDGPAEDNDSDEAKIVEPDKGFVSEPTANGR